MKFLSGLFLLLTLVLATAAQVTTEAERAQQAKAAANAYAAKYVAEGIKLHSEQLYVAASLSMTKALAIDPANRDALLHRGIEFYQDKQYQRASIDLERAAKFYPDDYVAGFQYGVVLDLTGFDADAYPYFQKAVERSPAKSIYRFYAGGAALRAGKFRECVEHLDAYLANPEGATAVNKSYIYLSRAECQIQIGNREAAKSDLAQSIAINRDSSWIYLSPIIEDGNAGCKGDADGYHKKAAELIDKKGDWIRAYREIFNALKCDPNHLKSLRLQLRIEAQSKLMNLQALNHYNRLARIDPETTPEVLDKFETAYGNRIQPKKDSNHYVDESPALQAQAKQYVQWYPDVKIVPEMPLGFKTAAEYINRAQEYFGANGKTYDVPGFGTVLSALNEALFLEPNNAAALLFRARTLAIFPDPAVRPLAWRDATAALRLNPQLALAYNVRGLVLKNEKNYPEAIDEFNKALSINPNEDKAYANLGSIYGLQDKPALALQNFTRAIEIAPDNKSWLALRGFAYFNLNKFPEAIADYKKVLALDEKNIEARLLLIRAYEKTGETNAVTGHVYTLLDQFPNDSRVKELAVRYPNASAASAVVKGAARNAESLSFRLETNRLVEEDNNLMNRIDSLIDYNNKNQSANDITGNREKTFRALDIVEGHKNKIVENSRTIISKANNFLAKYEKDKDTDQEIIQLAKTRIAESNTLIQQMKIYEDQWQAQRKRFQGVN